ncbi:hypothetical protein FRC02_002465 [Tulasnella sp. 418]|nr:hypothetical protein FRC02_002465 [Tulasnella sp. 418]
MQSGRTELKTDIQNGKTELKSEMQNNQAVVRGNQAELLEGQKQILDAVKEKVAQNMSSRWVENLIGSVQPLIGKSSLPTTTMPPPPKIFGRQEYIATAVNLIMSDSSARIAILGPGGMGKTSVALCIVHDDQVVDRFGDNIIWVPCEQATSVNLLIELLGKSILPSSSSSNDRFGEIVSFLKSSKKLYLILFDNFETPWDIPGQQSEVADILSHLASISTVSFIITMRAGQPPAAGSVEWTRPRLPPLPQLAMGPANEAFLRIAPDAADDSELETLLKELDCVPLAVTLMARLADAGEQPSDLLVQWRSEKTKLLDQPEGDRRNSIEVSIKLSLESRSVKANLDAINLLSVLAVLPAGMTLSRIEDTCPSIPDWRAALRILRAAALVYDSPDKKSIQLLSPIRSYTLLHHPLNPAALTCLRSAYSKLAKKGDSDPGDAGFIENSKELEGERVNIETILLDSLSEGTGDDESHFQIIDAAYCYSTYLYWTQPQTDILERAVALARTSASNLLPLCLELLGRMLYSQDMCEEAIAILSEAKAEFLKAGNGLWAHSCARWIGASLQALERYEEAYMVLKKGRDELMALGGSTDANRCYLAMGIVLTQQGKDEEAEDVLKEARTEFMKENDVYDAHQCLRFLANLYLETKRYEEAYSALEEVKKWCLDAGDSIMAMYCQVELGDVCCKMGRYSEAWSFLQDARVELEKRGVGGGFEFRKCLRFGGHAARMLGEYGDAIRWLQEAMTMFSSLSDTSVADWCSRELGMVYEAQRSTEPRS